MGDERVLTEAEAKLSELIDRVLAGENRIHISRDGVPAAALVSLEELESLDETIEVLSDRRLMRAIRRGRRQIARGKTVRWDNVKKDLNLK